MKLNLFLIMIVFTTICNAQIVNIPDANFKAKLLQASAGNTLASTQTTDSTGNVSSYNAIDTNGDGQIQVSEAQAIKYLNVGFSSISNLDGIQSFSSLQTLRCYSNQLTSLDVSGLTNLGTLKCSNNQLLSLDVSGLINLKSLQCPNNQLLSLDVSGLTNLKELECAWNKLPSLDVSGLTNLEELGCSSNQLLSLDASGLTNLETLDCSNNQLPSLDVSGLTNLTELHCYSNQLPSLDVSGLTNLEELGCSDNQLTSLDVSGTNLRWLLGSHNQLTSLNVSGLTNLGFLSCPNNQLPSLNVSGLTNLEALRCNNNQLTSLDISSNTSLYQLYCNDNQLTSLFIKNGRNEASGLYFQNNPNLTYICADEGQLTSVQDSVNQYGYTNCNVNTYCSFTPGGTFYTIQGNQKFDSNNNGCDGSDLVFPNFICSITDGASTGAFIANNSGSYNIPVQAGTHTVTPIIENPAYFNVSPTTLNISFPTATSPYIQDYCITANGTHHDVEVLLIPIDAARPGFDANYKLVYKNKGTSTQSGTVDFSYNDAVLDFVSSSPTIPSQSTGNLIWNFTNLLPFESREISFVLNLNSPMETPALNSGDILSYTASINGQTDETPNDNIATLNQTVVNSYDPNDKTCLEGARITPVMVGEYVHYLIRFENTGTFPAENIVVKDIIDISKFDINTLIPVHASHNFETRITNTNKVEFIFQNINLPFDDANNDGYITFKIKTNPNLVVGDTLKNEANIYFDYNFPILTNNYTTTIQNPIVGLQENYITNDLVAYPNPVKNILNFKTENTIIKVDVYDITGRIISSNSVTGKTMDLSELEVGNYILKIYTEKGIAYTKIMKE